MERTISSSKPMISKKGLFLIVSGIIWLATGSTFIGKGILYILENSHHILFHSLLGFVGGMILYFIYFNKIPRSFSGRIIDLENSKFGIFSLPNLKQYLLIGAIIVAFYFINKTSFFSKVDVSIIYICVGVPLSLSAFNFFFSVGSVKKYI